MNLLRNTTTTVTTATLLLSITALAQGPPTPGLAGEVQGSYSRVKVNILKSADNTPAEVYPFRPTPDIRTFARVINHITEAQMHSCFLINGKAIADLPKLPPETASKAEIVEALKASFTECDKAYGSVTDATASEMLQAGPTKRTRLGILWGNVSHDNEQYATLALYMRLKGLVPPSSEK